MVLAAAAAYLAACAVGIAAAAGRRLARWIHHGAYALCLVTTAAALWATGLAVLWVPAGALVLLPWAGAGGAAHRSLALLGAVGYVVACTTSWS